MKKLLMMATLLMTFGMMVAQIVEPVHWKTSTHVDGSKLTVSFAATIDEGFHLYDMDIAEGGPQKTEFTFEKCEGLKATGSPKVVKGKRIDTHDEAFDMRLAYYETAVTFDQTFEITAEKWKLEGYVYFMSCNDGMCTPPTRFEFDLKGEGIKKGAKPTDTQERVSEPATAETDITSEATAEADLGANPATAAQSTSTLGEESDLWSPVIEQLNAYGEGDGSLTGESHSWWYILLAGFIAGLLAVVTPCVWPMIPMTMSFFLKRNKNSRGAAIKEAFIYGASIIVIYVALGLCVTAMFGASALNSLATNAVFNIVFFLLLVVFAFSFFGAFEIALPASWTTKLDEKADATTGLLSIFFMAFTLCLVSFSCTGPIIGTLLVEAATSGSMLYPAIGMFGFAFALALPFALIALFPQMLKSMPKSGGWLNMVKVVLGFCELALALKFLSVADLAYGWGILDRETFLCLWIVIFFFLGLYLLGFIRLPHDDDPQPSDRVSVTRLMMALISMAFAIYMIPGLWGAPCKAISAFAPPASTQDFSLYDGSLKPQAHDYEEAMLMSKRTGKPVLVDFSGFGCVNCRKMEGAVWTNERVKSYIEKNYILVELMVDDKTPLAQTEVIEENGKTMKLRTIGDKWSYLQQHKFGANAQPFHVLLNADGQPLNTSYSYDEDIEKYMKWLETGIANNK